MTESLEFGNHQVGNEGQEQRLWTAKFASIALQREEIDRTALGLGAPLVSSVRRYLLLVACGTLLCCPLQLVLELRPQKRSDSWTRAMARRWTWAEAGEWDCVPRRSAHSRYRWHVEKICRDSEGEAAIRARDHEGVSSLLKMGGQATLEMKSDRCAIRIRTGKRRTMVFVHSIEGLHTKDTGGPALLVIWARNDVLVPRFKYTSSPPAPKSADEP